MKMRIYNENEIAASILLVLPRLGTTSAQTIAEFSVFRIEREAVFYHAMQSSFADAEMWFEDELDLLSDDEDEVAKEKVPIRVWERLKWWNFDSAMHEVLFHYVPEGWFLAFTIFDDQHHIEWDPGNFDIAFGNWFYQGLQYDEDIFIRDLKEDWVKLLRHYS